MDRNASTIRSKPVTTVSSGASCPLTRRRVPGRADVGIATIGTSSPVPPGLVGDVLLKEPYALVHPAGHPDPRSLPLVDWAENCSSCDRSWWSEQDWIPSATVQAEDDGTVLSIVSSGLGMAIMPVLSLTVAVRALIRELRALRPPRSLDG